MKRDEKPMAKSKRQTDAQDKQFNLVDPRWRCFLSYSFAGYRTVLFGRGCSPSPGRGQNMQDTLPRLVACLAASLGPCTTLPHFISFRNRGFSCRAPTEPVVHGMRRPFRSNEVAISRLRSSYSSVVERTRTRIFEKQITWQSSRNRLLLPFLGTRVLE